MENITATIISAIAQDTRREVKYKLSNSDNIRVVRFSIDAEPTEIEEYIKIDLEAKQAQLDALLPTEIE